MITTKSNWRKLWICCMNKAWIFLFIELVKQMTTTFDYIYSKLNPLIFHNIAVENSNKVIVDPDFETGA